MSSMVADPVTVRVLSSTGTTGRTATIPIADGKYEIISLTGGNNLDFAVRCDIGFQYKLGDGTIISNTLHNGWACYGKVVTLPSPREVVGPGYIYAYSYFDVSAYVTLIVTYRRILP